MSQIETARLAQAHDQQKPEAFSPTRLIIAEIIGSLPGCHAGLHRGWRPALQTYWR